MTILVTGSAGIIGANFVLDWLAQHDKTVIKHGVKIECQSLGPFVVSLSNHKWLPARMFTLRQAQGERLFMRHIYVVMFSPDKPTYGDCLIRMPGEKNCPNESN